MNIITKRDLAANRSSSTKSNSTRLIVAQWLSPGESSYFGAYPFPWRRRRMTPRPTSPIPIIESVNGSGTGACVMTSSRLRKTPGVWPGLPVGLYWNPRV